MRDKTKEMSIIAKNTFGNFARPNKDILCDSNHLHSKMEPPLLAFSKSFPHLLEKILLSLHTSDIMRLTQVCKQMLTFIMQCEKIWKVVMKRLRFKYILIDPFWVTLQGKMVGEDYPKVCLKIMEYSPDNFEEKSKRILAITNLRNYHTVTILYGHLPRLVYFWRKMGYLEPPRYVLLYLACIGKNDCLHFLLEHMPNLKSHLDGRWSGVRGDSPLHIACFYQNISTVKLLLTYYEEMPRNNYGDTPIVHSYLNQEPTEITRLLVNWFGPQTEGLEGELTFEDIH